LTNLTSDGNLSYKSTEHFHIKLSPEIKSLNNSISLQVGQRFSEGCDIVCFGQRKKKRKKSLIFLEN